MNGVGFCDFCKVDMPVLELVAHITTKHQAFPGVPVLRWPYGKPAIVDTSLEPADFMDEATAGLLAVILRTRRQRAWAWIRTYLLRR